MSALIGFGAVLRVFSREGMKEAKSSRVWTGTMTGATWALRRQNES